MTPFQLCEQLHLLSDAQLAWVVGQALGYRGLTADIADGVVCRLDESDRLELQVAIDNDPELQVGPPPN